jgi:putative drug exporter of the RND superfamily
MHRQIAGKLTGPVIKWFVLAVWLVLGIGSSVLGSKLIDVQDNQASSWLPGNAESTKALAKLEAFQSQNVIPTTVVYERTEGLSPDDLAAAKADAQEFADIDGVTGKVIGPIPSQDGQAAQTLVTFNFGKDGWNKMPDAADELRKIADQSGVSVHIAGQGGQAADSAEAFGGIDGILLVSTLLVVILILLVTYRSPVLWILPIFSAVIGLFTAQAVVYLLAKYADLTVNGQSQGILTVLVIGAGTDYALLLVARYREELRRHDDRHEAMAFALHRASPAIFASGMTVVLGMLCLLLAEMNSTAGLGPVLAVGILAALAVMTTLLPALLVICGRWVFWPKRPHVDSDEPTSTGVWARIGGRISRRPRRVWVGTAVALVALSFGLLDLHADGLSNKASFRGHPDSVVGESVLAAHFPAGAGTPVVVVSDAAAAPAVRTAFTRVNGIVDVTPALLRNGVAYIQGTMTAAPDSSPGYRTIDQVRAAVHPVSPSAKVGGGTAINLDVNRAAKRDRSVIIPIVLLVVFGVLALLLRALIAPVVLIATVVLSFGAALGVSALLFHHLFHFGGVDTGFPLFVFVFLVALGIDYNIFLMTRVREEALKHGTRQGALIGLAATGGVITSAGFVLAGTFAVLATLPLIGFAEMGFTVALGVLLDTLVVRSILVTALNLEIGDRMWWPSRLARRGREIERLPAAEPATVS